MTWYICDENGNVVRDFEVCEDCLDEVISVIIKAERQCKSECEI